MLLEEGGAQLLAEPLVLAAELLAAAAARDTLAANCPSEGTLGLLQLTASLLTVSSLLVPFPAPAAAMPSLTVITHHVPRPATRPSHVSARARRCRMCWPVSRRGMM